MTTTGIATIIAIAAIVCLVIYLGNILYKKNIPATDKSKKVCCGTSCTSKSVETEEEGCVGPVREYTKPQKVEKATCVAKTEEEARKGICTESCKQSKEKTAEKKPATKKKPVAKSKAKATTNTTKTKATKKKTTSTAKTPKTKK